MKLAKHTGDSTAPLARTYHVAQWLASLDRCLCKEIENWGGCLGDSFNRGCGLSFHLSVCLAFILNHRFPKQSLQQAGWGLPHLLSSRPTVKLKALKSDVS